jgi:cytochrome P450
MERKLNTFVPVVYRGSTRTTGGDAVGDLHDPDWYLGEDVHQTFAELRRSDPVHWQDLPDEPGFWAVLRHADVVHVSRHPETFSSWLGGVMLEDPDPETLENTRRMLLVMDPPQHTAYRQPLAPHFGARVIGRMEQRIRARCRDLLAGAADKGYVDFCHDVAGPLASETIAEIMGLPLEDTPKIRRWAEMALGGQDQEVRDSQPGNASLEMIVYAIEWAGRRRAMPRREDVTSLLLESTFENGEPMSDVEFGSFFFQLVTAGNDTTRTLISSGTERLIRHPDQMQAMREDAGLIPSAVEEVLRFCNPVHYLRRTAASDTELGGKRVKAGDKVALYFTSANRDEDVFIEPQRFDIRRTPNPHLSFGIGSHFCLGAHVARLQARLFFEELLSGFSTIELGDAPTKVRSNLTNGYRRLPVRLGR